MPIQWIEHEGERVLFIDASNLQNDHTALSEHLETLLTLLTAEPKNSVLGSADLRNTHLSNNALMVLMRSAPLAAPYFLKSALVIEPNYARRVVLDSFSMVLKHLPKRFSDLDAAKAWLVGDTPRHPMDSRAEIETSR